ncbi:MAG: alpha/beta hydrolase [Novosphingobium sp.]|nr:alpha/beta hydrolase [Novosphingobium sp.]MCB2078426.1 alpha/beta hydrolase [Novosphingobium sp.]
MEGALHIPARVLRVPDHLSPEAQAAMRQPVPDEIPDYPPLDDKQGWRERIAASEGVILQMIGTSNAAFEGTVSELREGEAQAFEITPAGIPASDRRVYLDIHGGGLINGAGEVCRAMGINSALQVGARTVSVDYRMPPDHPYPVGLDDCLAFYRALLRDHDPAEIVVGGGSAGGNLVVAMILKARDEGLPLPAGAVLVTPEVDLTESGDSFQTNIGLDRTLRVSLMPANLLYADGRDLTDPYISPLFGDFTTGFPPTILTAGTRDLFLSNAVRMHRALRNAGIPAELHVVEALSHGFFGGAPEDAEIDREVRAFCERCWGG